MEVAAILLTGGASRRMGQDKAALPSGAPADHPGPETLAARTGRLLQSVAALAIEVGPGRSGLPAVPDDHPGAGPLAAVATGAAAVAMRGWAGPALVVATDLPRLTLGMLRWLADHPSPGSVVPVDRGYAQPLCARYHPDDLAVARALVAAGERSLRALLDSIAVTLAGPRLWVEAAGCSDALCDVDTPGDLASLLGSGPPL